MKTSVASFLSLSTTTTNRSSSHHPWGVVPPKNQLSLFLPSPPPPIRRLKPTSSNDIIDHYQDDKSDDVNINDAAAASKVRCSTQQQHNFRHDIYQMNAAALQQLLMTHQLPRIGQASDDYSSETFTSITDNSTTATYCNPIDKCIVLTLTSQLLHYGVQHSPSPRDTIHRQKLNFTCGRTNGSTSPS